MNKKKLMWAAIVVCLLLMCLVDTSSAKRAFAIRMRSKSHNSGSGISRNSRKNYHQAHVPDTVNHGGMVRNPPVPDVPAAPIGPPPAYPGLSHIAVPAGGAPPAYSRIAPPSYAEAMGYNSHAQNYGSVSSPGRHYDYNTNNNNLHSAYSDNNIGGYGSNYGYHRGSNPFSVGSILTGAALWQLGHGLAHSGHHHYNHYHNYYDHHHDHQEAVTGSTLAPENDNPHIQVNADFDFGPTPAPTEDHDHGKPAEPVQK